MTNPLTVFARLLLLYTQLLFYSLGMKALERNFLFSYDPCKTLLPLARTGQWGERKLRKSLLVFSRLL